MSATATTVRRLLGLTRLVAVGHAIALVLQPVWAGLYLGARYEMLDVHWTGANVVFTLGVVQPVLALALWWAAQAGAWFVLASGALLVGETVQFFAGLDGDLAVHVPLGVGLVTGGVLTAGSLMSPRALRATARPEVTR